MPEFDLSMPANLSRGSYHPITLVQRQCEQIFESMGFTVEDYAEVVTDYECFEAVNVPKTTRRVICRILIILKTVSFSNHKPLPLKTLF